MAPVAFYILRVSFGVALLSSIALIFTAILVLQSSSRDDRDRDRGGGTLGCGVGASGRGEGLVGFGSFFCVFVSQCVT